MEIETWSSTYIKRRDTENKIRNKYAVEIMHINQTLIKRSPGLWYINMYTHNRTEKSGIFLYVLRAYKSECSWWGCYFDIFQLIRFHFDYTAVWSFRKGKTEFFPLSLNRKKAAALNQISAWFLIRPESQLQPEIWISEQTVLNISLWFGYGDIFTNKNRRRSEKPFKLLDGFRWQL